MLQPSRDHCGRCRYPCGILRRIGAEPARGGRPAARRVCFGGFSVKRGDLLGGIACRPVICAFKPVCLGPHHLVNPLVVEPLQLHRGRVYPAVVVRDLHHDIRAAEKPIDQSRFRFQLLDVVHDRWWHGWRYSLKVLECRQAERIAGLGWYFFKGYHKLFCIPLIEDNDCVIWRHSRLCPQCTQAYADFPSVRDVICFDITFVIYILAIILQKGIKHNSAHFRIRSVNIPDVCDVSFVDLSHSPLPRIRCDHRICDDRRNCIRKDRWRRQDARCKPRRRHEPHDRRGVHHARRSEEKHPPACADIHLWSPHGPHLIA